MKLLEWLYDRLTWDDLFEWVLWMGVILVLLSMWVSIMVPRHPTGYYLSKSGDTTCIAVSMSWGIDPLGICSTDQDKIVTILKSLQKGEK